MATASSISSPPDLGVREVSAISWPAIIGGAFGAFALALILLALGTGFGFASISPWSHSGVTASTFTIATAIWLIIVEIIAFGVGGYIAGRLRTKWVGTHSNEVYFRDTAHGFLTWALATVVGAFLFVSAASSVAERGAETGALAAATAGGAAAGGLASMTGQGGGQAGSKGGAGGYFVDMLFRSDHPSPETAAGNGGEVRAEAGRIVATSLANGGISQPDKAYLAQLVAQRTGMSQADAGKRVDDAIGQAKAAAAKAEQTARQAADAARKAASALAFWSFIAMLIGAFCASFAATFGGRQRDRAQTR